MSTPIVARVLNRTGRRYIVGLLKWNRLRRVLNMIDDIVERLKGVKVPVLLVHGDDDRTWTAG